MALNAAWQWRSTASDPGANEKTAATQAAELIVEHYIQSPDLDLCLADGGNSLDESELQFLQAVIEKSPHRHVRATALYFYAKRLATEYLWYRTMEQSGWNKVNANPRMVEMIKGARSGDVKGGVGRDRFET